MKIDEGTDGMRPAELRDRQRWVGLLRRLDPGTLTDSLIDLLVQVDGYQPSPIPKAEILRTTRLSLAAIIDGLCTGDLDVSIAIEIGESRARAGVPLDALMTAIRYDFSVLWDALTEVSHEDDAGLIVRHTRTVLRAVDEYVGQAQRAYLAEAQRMQEESASHRRELLESLFHQASLTKEHLASIALELTIPVNAPLIVAAASGGDMPALQECVSAFKRQGTPIHEAQFEGALIAFAPHDPAVQFSGLDEKIRELRVGLTVAGKGIAALQRAAAFARDLSMLFSPTETGAMTWERGWARQAARGLQASGTPVLPDVDAALAACADAKRSRILEAVRSYLDTGNISQSAQDLYCHRNTVSKHLRQFQEITGVDATVPRQAARLVVGWA